MDKENFSAAQRLRKSVHSLAKRILDLDIPTSKFHELAEIIENSTEDLIGEKVPKWWSKDSGSGKFRSMSYRSRSLFQGELHLFSPELEWKEDTGPEGQPGYSFTVNLSELYEGPPLAVHGGFIAGLFDELLGAVQSLSSGGTGYTAKLNIKYRSFTPINSDLQFSGWLVESSGRRIKVKAQCLEGKRICSEADALFLRPRETQLGNNG